MTYELIDVDPELYVEAAVRARQAAEGVRLVVSKAVRGHQGHGSSAGGDHAGAAFAEGHDTTAAAFFSGAGKLATALDAIADRLQASGYLHAAAEWAAAGNAGAPPGFALPADAGSTTFGTIPSLRGGHGNMPDGWHFIEAVASDLLFPDSDKGKLLSAATVWATLDTELANVVNTRIVTLLDPLTANKAPDIAAIQRVVEPVVEYARSLVTVPNALSNAVRKFSGFSEAVGNFIINLLEQLLIAIAAQEIVGGLLDAVTFGGGTLVATGATVIEISDDAVTITTEITLFITRARTLAEILGDAIAPVTRVLDGIGDAIGGGAGSVAARALFVVFKGGVGAVTGAAVAGGYYAVTNIGHESLGEFEKDVFDGGAAGFVGGAVGDGVGTAWASSVDGDAGDAASELASAGDVHDPTDIADNGSISGDSSADTDGDAATDPTGTLKDPEPEADDADSPDAKRAKALWHGAGAVAGFSTGDILSGEHNPVDPNNLIDPNIRGAMEGLESLPGEPVK